VVKEGFSSPANTGTTTRSYLAALGMRKDAGFSAGCQVLGLNRAEFDQKTSGVKAMVCCELERCCGAKVVSRRIFGLIGTC